MSTCDSTFVKGQCPGHLGKFQDCDAEALWTLSLDQGNADTEFGDTDWHGYFALFLLNQSESVELDPDGSDDRVVIVPPGNYLLRTYTSGAVGYEAVGDRDYVVGVCEEREGDYRDWAIEDEN